MFCWFWSNLRPRPKVVESNVEYLDAEPGVHGIVDLFSGKPKLGTKYNQIRQNMKTNITND